MPGMGALPDIFKHLKITPQYRVKYLRWVSPHAGETLEQYTARMIKEQISAEDKNPVLAGMSFGGILVHEMSRQMPVKALIFLSTVKTHREFPPWFALGRLLRYDRWAPFGLLQRPEKLKAFVPFKVLRKRLELYEKYLGIRDTYYFHWAVRQILFWKGEKPSLPYVHIHGDQDRIFPGKFLIPPVEWVRGGTHLAVMTHPRQVSARINAFLESL